MLKDSNDPFQTNTMSYLHKHNEAQIVWTNKYATDKNEILIPHKIGSNGVLHMKIFNCREDSKSPCSFSASNSIRQLVAVTNDAGI